MSVRQFANFIGVSHTTILNVLEMSDSDRPSFEFLVRLAKATNIDIRELAAMAAPDLVNTTGSASAAVLSARIQRLNDEQKKIIDRLIAGFTLEGPNDKTD